mgnify:FL=1
MKEIKFTPEELLYIEKLFDINASNAEVHTRKNIENFIMLKALGEEKLCRLSMDSVLELEKAQLITKSIRDKIESWRKEWDFYFG